MIVNYQTRTSRAQKHLCLLHLDFLCPIYVTRFTHSLIRCILHSNVQIDYTVITKCNANKYFIKK